MFRPISSLPPSNEIWAFLKTSSGGKVRPFLLLDDQCLQLYPQCSVMMRSCWKKCLFFCRHFFSTRLKNYAPSGCGASRPWIRRRRAAWKLLLRAPSLVRRVNNKQKPHCCLSAQGLRECRHVVAVMALYAYPSSFPASSIPLTFHRPFSSSPPWIYLQSTLKLAPKWGPQL